MISSVLKKTGVTFQTQAKAIEFICLCVYLLHALKAVGG